MSTANDNLGLFFSLAHVHRQLLYLFFNLLKSDAVSISVF